MQWPHGWQCVLLIGRDVRSRLPRARLSVVQLRYRWRPAHACRLRCEHVHLANITGRLRCYQYGMLFTKHRRYCMRGSGSV